MSLRLIRPSIPTLAAVVLAAALLFSMLGAPVGANHQPADKIAVAGSGLEVLDADFTEAESETVTLMSGILRASSPTDLIISVTAECSIITDVTTIGNDDQQAAAQLKIWVERNGEVIPVASDDANDPGKVVYCDRTYRRVTDLFDDEDATIRTYIETRSANAFNWITLNIGNGIHEIDVKAQLVKSPTTAQSHAEGLIGKRTLVVQPVKLSNDASI